MKDTDILAFDIYDIYTVVEKKEAAGFRFDTPCREWDGFVLFTEGEAELSIDGRLPVRVKSGDIVFFRKKDRYAFFAEKPCTYITSGFTFTDRSEEFASCFGCSIRKCTPPQVEYICSIAREWEMHRYDSMMSCRIKLLSLYLDFFRSETAGRLSDTDPAVSLAIDFLHANFKRNYSTDEIARHCSLSPSYLRARFRSTTGMTLTDYRDILRLKAAKELLASGIFSVKETASELGFCDVYHFSKFFTSHTGITPAKYSKESQDIR